MHCEAFSDLFCCVILQSHEVGHSDISVQPLTSDEDGEIKVAAAGRSTVQEDSNEVLESTSQSVDKLTDETVTSPVCSAGPPTVCDTGEIVHSEVESKSHENIATADEQAGSEVVCDKTIVTTDDENDATSHQRLDGAVTSVINDKLDSDVAAVVSEDNTLGIDVVNTEMSEAESQSADQTATYDSDVPVKDGQPEPADIIDNSTGSDVHSDKEIDESTEAVSECREIEDGNDRSAGLGDIPVLPDDAVRVNTELTGTVETSISSSMAQDLPIEPSCTETQSGDVIPSSDADIVSDNAEGESGAEVSLQRHQSGETPEMVMAGAEKQADGLPESRSKDADESVEVCHGFGGGVSVHVDEVTPSGSVDAETVAQFEHGDDVEPVCSEAKDADVVSSTGDDVPVAESGSQQSITFGVDDETAAKSEHTDVDVASPTCGETVHVDAVSATDANEPVAESDSQKSISDSIDAATAAESEHPDADVALPACSEAVHVDVVSAPGDDVAISSGVAVAESDNLPSRCVVKSIDDVKDTVQDSPDGLEATGLETGGGDLNVTGEWLDNVVNVSDISFVKKDDIPDEVCADLSKERDTEEVAVTDVIDGGNAAAAETSLEAVAVVNVDTKKEQIDIGKPSSNQNNTENSVTMVENADTVCDSVTVNADTAVSDSGEPVGGEVNAQKPETDGDGRTEKSRLYSKNIKSDIPSTGPAACLAADVKNTSKAGTPPQQDTEVTGDQPNENQSVVMRKKSTPELDSAGDKENEASKITRVRTAFLLFYT